jgi:mannobiose 2-epimerase
MFRHLSQLVLALAALLLLQGPSGAAELPTADEVERAWLKHDMNWWFPRSADRAGGFHEGFDDRRRPTRSDRKSVVFQARMTWTAATALRMRPELRTRLAPATLHGLRFMRLRMLDPEGGIYWQTDRRGRPLRDGQKHLYGVAFAIYAGAAVERALPDRGGADFAMELFTWLDEEGHDAAHGGYREHYDLPRNADPVLAPEVGTKSLNAHLHLLEAFAELYRARPDPLVADRLRELIDLHLGPMYAEPGILHEVFSADWQPLADETSYGHNIEAAFLVADALDALGQTPTPEEERKLRALMDSTLEVGWHQDIDAIAERGTATRAAAIRASWWSHAEMLNAAVYFADRARRSGDDEAAARYESAAARTWRFIDRELFDHDTGGWRATAGVDYEERKSGPWKASYHTTRSLLNTADTLRRWEQAQVGSSAATDR